MPGTGIPALVRAIDTRLAELDDEIEGLLQLTLRNAEWLRREYCDNHRTAGDIAEQLGCNRPEVSKWVVVHGLQMPLCSVPGCDKRHRHHPLGYCDKHRRIWAIWGDPTVSYRNSVCPNCGFGKRPDSAICSRCVSHMTGRKSRSSAFGLDDRSWLKAQREQKSVRQIADELGCAPASVADWCVRHGITQKQNRWVLVLTEDWLRAHDGWSPKEVAEATGCASTTAAKYMKRFGTYHRQTAVPRPHVVHDLTGQRFGRWTVLSRADHAMWKCRCVCGHERSVAEKSLLDGRSQSCGGRARGGQCDPRPLRPRSGPRHSMYPQLLERAWLARELETKPSYAVIGEGLGCPEGSVRYWCRVHGLSSPRCRRAVKYWTAERIIERMHDWHRSTGQPPTATDWRRHRSMRSRESKGQIDGGWPSVATVRNVFGNWNAGLEAAGFPTRRFGGRQSQR